jgi:hypothetical protein
MRSALDARARRVITTSVTETQSATPPSLASLVGAGKGVDDIAKALGLPSEEVRSRLQKTGLLAIVEPDGPETTTKAAPTGTPAAAPLPAKEEKKPVPPTTETTGSSNGATMDPHNKAPKRVRKPRVAAAAKPVKPKAKTKRRGRPTNAEIAARAADADRAKQDAVKTAYGTLYLAAQKSGVSIDELIAAAKVVNAN